MFLIINKLLVLAVPTNIVGPWGVDARAFGLALDRTTNNDDAEVQKVVDVVVPKNSRTVVIPSDARYTNAVNWRGGKAINNSLPAKVNSVTWPDANLNARMTVADGYLYVAEYSNNKVAVFSLANPKKPRYLHSFATGSQPRYVEVVGRYVFVACHGASTIEIHNISNIITQTTKTVVGTIITGANPKMFQIVGNIIYVVCYGTSTLEKYSYILPSGTTAFSSVKLGQVAVSSGPLALAVNDEGIIAVCGLGTNNLELISASFLLYLSATPIGSAGHASCVWVNKTQLLMTDSANARL